MRIHHSGSTTTFKNFITLVLLYNFPDTRGWCHTGRDTDAATTRPHESGYGSSRYRASRSEVRGMGRMRFWHLSVRNIITGDH